MSLKQENLISTSVQYKVGQRLVKVGNSFVPVGFGGNFEPGGLTPEEPECQSMKFYKCISVDTDNKTWSGYELVLQDGKYIVSETLTEGLTYTTMTPVENYSYSEDALIRVGLYYSGVPTDGLVFYASLNGETPDVAETGQYLSQVNADDSQPVQYTTVNGVPCASFGTANYSDECGYGGLSFNASDLPQGSSHRTISFWVKFTPILSEGYCLFYGNYSRGNMVGAASSVNYNTINFTYHGDDAYSQGFDFADKLHHVVMVFKGSTNADITYYYDGVKQEMSYVGYGSVSINTYGGTCYIGCGRSGWLSRFDGWMSSIRVYDRALSQEEITALSKEFTPTGV